MDTNPAIAMYRKLSKMEAEPMEKPKDGLLSKTMSSTKARKYKPNVDATMRISRYMQDIRDIDA